MRFTLLDRIVSLRPGASIDAVKGLSLAEEYLKDHFPLFPVMPGVLMLEAMYQASAWLLRETDDFAYSLVTLKEAKNVKYADFVEPGEVLHLTAEIQKRDGRLTWFKAQGTVDGQVAVSARLVLDQCNLADGNPALRSQDLYLIRRLREEYDLLNHSCIKMGSVT